MALTLEAREALLQRAQRLALRTLAQYLVETAPPVDLKKYPDVAKRLDELARRERAAALDLAQASVDMGLRLPAAPSYPLRYPALHYVGTAFALEALAKEVEAGAREAEAIAAEARGDASEVALEPFRVALVEGRTIVDEMRASIHKAKAAEKPAPLAFTPSGTGRWRKKPAPPGGNPAPAAPPANPPAPAKPPG